MSPEYSFFYRFLLCRHSRGDLKGDLKGNPKRDPKEDPKGDPKRDLKEGFFSKEIFSYI